MAASSRRKPNPELEQLRQSVPKQNVNAAEELVNELIAKTCRIHATYLFGNKGRQLLQKLCLCLSSTKSNHFYSGWEELGVHLNVDILKIKCIKTSFNNEDPTHYLLLTYSQNDDATLAEIVKALYKIKRYDILTQISELVRKISVLDSYEKTLLPKIPFALRNIDADKDKQQSNSTVQVEKDFVSFKRKYSKTVFLTFASDSKSVADAVLSKLRKPKKKEGASSSRLGVITLEENADTVYANPEQFIQESVSLVDYVIPIISKGYLKLLSESTPLLESAIESLDHKYAAYVYTLINTLYSRNGCKNKKVRCIIPDDMFGDVQNHWLMHNSIFQIWVLESNVDKLIDRIH